VAIAVGRAVLEYKGDLALFFDYDNTQSLCAPHHDQAKQQIEVRGYSSEVGAVGMPVDPNHPFNTP
jgi:5-methylcytosine-specific restriction enzyme A